MKDEQVITRTAFCSRCWTANRPDHARRVLSYGSTHKEYLLTEAHIIGKRGFVPHIIKYAYEGDNVRTESFCAIEGCGITIPKINNDGSFFFKVEHTIHGLVTRSQFHNVESRKLRALYIF